MKNKNPTEWWDSLFLHYFSFAIRLAARIKMFVDAAKRRQDSNLEKSRFGKVRTMRKKYLFESGK